MEFSLRAFEALARAWRRSSRRRRLVEFLGIPQAGDELLEFSLRAFEALARAWRRSSRRRRLVEFLGILRDS